MAATIQWGMGASLDRFHKGVGLAVTIDAAFPLTRIFRRSGRSSDDKRGFPSRKAAPLNTEWNIAMENPL
jgi:hypothetical protein